MNSKSADIKKGLHLPRNVSVNSVSRNVAQQITLDQGTGFGMLLPMSLERCAGFFVSTDVSFNPIAYYVLSWNTNLADVASAARPKTANGQIKMSAISTTNTGLTGYTNAVKVPDFVAAYMNNATVINYTYPTSIAPTDNVLANVPLWDGVAVNYINIDPKWVSKNDEARVANPTLSTANRVTFDDYNFASVSQLHTELTGTLNEVRAWSNPLPTGISSSIYPMFAVSDMQFFVQAHVSNTSADLSNLYTIQFWIRLKLYNIIGDTLYNAVNLASQFTYFPIITPAVYPFPGLQCSSVFNVALRDLSAPLGDVVTGYSIEIIPTTDWEVAQPLLTPLTARADIAYTTVDATRRGVGYEPMIFTIQGVSPDVSIGVTMSQHVDTIADSKIGVFFDANQIPYDPCLAEATEEVVSNLPTYGIPQLYTVSDAAAYFSRFEQALRYAYADNGADDEEMLTSAYALLEANGQPLTRYDSSGAREGYEMGLGTFMNKLGRNLRRAGGEVAKAVTPHFKQLAKAAKTVAVQNLDEFLKKGALMDSIKLGNVSIPLLTSPMAAVPAPLRQAIYDRAPDLKTQMNMAMQAAVDDGMGRVAGRFLAMDDVKPVRSTRRVLPQEYENAQSNKANDFPGKEVKVPVQPSSRDFKVKSADVTYIPGVRMPGELEKSPVDVGALFALVDADKVPFVDGSFKTCSRLGNFKIYGWKPASENPAEKLAVGLLKDVAIATVVSLGSDVVLRCPDFPVACRSLEFGLYVHMRYGPQPMCFSGALNGLRVKPLPNLVAAVKAEVAHANSLLFVANSPLADHCIADVNAVVPYLGFKLADVSNTAAMTVRMDSRLAETVKLMNQAGTFVNHPMSRKIAELRDKFQKIYGMDLQKKVQPSKAGTVKWVDLLLNSSIYGVDDLTRLDQVLNAKLTIPWAKRALTTVPESYEDAVSLLWFFEVCSFLYRDITYVKEPLEELPLGLVQYDYTDDQVPLDTLMVDARDQWPLVFETEKGVFYLQDRSDGTVVLVDPITFLPNSRVRMPAEYFESWVSSWKEALGECKFFDLISESVFAAATQYPRRTRTRRQPTLEELYSAFDEEMPSLGGPARQFGEQPGYTAAPDNVFKLKRRLARKKKRTEAEEKVYEALMQWWETAQGEAPNRSRKVKYTDFEPLTKALHEAKIDLAKVEKKPKPPQSKKLLVQQVTFNRFVSFKPVPQSDVSAATVQGICPVAPRDFLESEQAKDFYKLLSATKMDDNKRISLFHALTLAQVDWLRAKGLYKDQPAILEEAVAEEL